MSARVACVCVHTLALQTLLRDRPAWRRAPVALVDEERPDAPLTALNAAAWRAGLTPGIRLGAARNLVPTLRAAAVPDARVADAVRALADALRTCAPGVEPDARAGVFTVDASGLGRLHRDARTWALTVRRAVLDAGFAGSVVVGFDRRTARAIALHTRRVVVARNWHDELAVAAAVPLDALGLPRAALSALDALGLRTLGDLWTLPRETVHHRFGPAVADARAWPEREPSLPVQPDLPRAPERTVIEVDPPDDDVTRLLFALRGALHLLTARLASHGEAIAAVHLDLALDDRTHALHRIEPASATRDVALLIDLLRLRLTEQHLSAPVREAVVTVEPAALRGEQLHLFAHERLRDPHAVARAVARVRAAFGDASVSRPALRDAHLPEARFTWEPWKPLPSKRTTPLAPREVPLMRRIVAPPREVSPHELRTLRPVEQREALAVPEPTDARDPLDAPWLQRAPVNDASHDAWNGVAPTRVEGAWWHRTVERDYYYAETRDGALWWVFFDRARGRWFQQGVVD